MNNRKGVYYAMNSTDKSVQELVEAHNSGRITRRDFVIQAGLLIGGAATGMALIGDTANAASPNIQATMAATMAATPAAPDIKLTTKMIEFPTKGAKPTAPGYLAYPAEGKGPFPAVVVLQEWWGLDDHIKWVTELMARSGFAALAPDLYRGQVAKEPNDAQKLAMGLIMDQAISDVQGAADYLAAQDYATKKVGVMGFCMGGGIAFRMAWQGADNIAAVVAFYGNANPTDANLQAVKVPILGLYGEADQGIKPDNVKQWEAKLKEFGKTSEFHIYPGAPHAFFNNTRPSYNQAAALDGYKRTVDWFNKYLGGASASATMAATMSATSTK